MSSDPVKSEIYIQVLPESITLETAPGELFTRTFMEGHHCFAVRGDMASVEARFEDVEHREDGSCVLVMDEQGGRARLTGSLVVPKLFFVLVEGLSYVCIPNHEHGFLTAEDFQQAITEARFLKVDVVCWNERRDVYDYSRFQGVLKRAVMDVAVHGFPVKKVFKDVVETSSCKGFISISFENGSLNENRASKCALGSLEEVLFGYQEGLFFQGGYEAQTLEFNTKRIHKIYRVSGASTQAHLVRCGMYIGPSLAGRDGFCGPDNGPACQKCKDRQKSVPDKWDVEVKISSDDSTTNVCVLMRPCLEEESFTAQKRARFCTRL